MNVLKTLKTKLDSNTFSTICASLVWVGASKLFNGFNTLKGKERNECLELIALADEITLDAIAIDIDMMMGTFTEAPTPTETITSLEDLDPDQQMRCGRRKITVDAFNARVRVNNDKDQERHVAMLTAYGKIKSELHAEITTASKQGANLDYKFSDITANQLLVKAYEKLNGRYEDLMVRATTASGDYKAKVEDQLDTLEDVLDDLANELPKAA